MMPCLPGVPHQRYSFAAGNDDAIEAALDAVDYDTVLDGCEYIFERHGEEPEA